MKMKTKVTKKVRTEIPDREATLVDRKFWTTLIPPGGPIVLGKNLYLGTMVMQNHGPGSIMVDTGYVDDDVKLQPGQVRVMSTRQKIQVATTDGKRALLEFEFMLALK
jgi:hypothetical protein